MWQRGAGDSREHRGGWFCEWPAHVTGVCASVRRSDFTREWEWEWQASGASDKRVGSLLKLNGGRITQRSFTHLHTSAFTLSHARSRHHRTFKSILFIRQTHLQTMKEQENILLYSFGPLPTPLPQVSHLDTPPPPALILSSEFKFPSSLFIGRAALSSNTKWGLRISVGLIKEIWPIYQIYVQGAREGLTHVTNVVKCQLN